MATHPKNVSMPAEQSNLALFGGVVRGGMKAHPVMEVMACNDDRDIALEMIKDDPIRGRHTGFYAQQMGIKAPAWSRMLNGSFEFKLSQRQWRILSHLTRSKLHAEYVALDEAQSDLTPHVQTTEEKAALFDAQQSQQAQSA